MFRKSRLAFLATVNRSEKLLVKDHITGEVMHLSEIAERFRDGFYSTYQVRHLDLSKY